MKKKLEHQCEKRKIHQKFFADNKITSFQLQEKNVTVFLEEADTPRPKYYSAAAMNHLNDLIPAQQIE